MREEGKMKEGGERGKGEEEKEGNLMNSYTMTESWVAG